MFSKAHIYQHYRLIKWDVADPAQEIEQFKSRIKEYIDQLKVPGLTCSDEQISIGGSIFGREKIDAVVTSFDGLPFYAVSFGFSYGVRSVWLATLRCASDKAGANDPGIVEALTRGIGSRPLKDFADLDFVDATLRQMFDSATG